MKSMRIPEKPKLIRSTNGISEKYVENSYGLDFEVLLQKWSLPECKEEQKEKGNFKSRK